MAELLHPFTLVLFGANGDLSLRKLIPSLFNLHQDGRLHDDGYIVAVTRSDENREAYLEQAKAALCQFEKTPDEKIWRSFSARINHIQMDASKAAGYSKLAKKLAHLPNNRIFYCAVHSRMYPQISEQLFAHDLISAESRIVLEKPIGTDFASAMHIDQRVAEFFAENQIFRIDHYLGKETVQNLLALRFANSIFEHQWNQRYIDHIQITISETVGVEKRAGFYEGTGAMRDMLQNHLLQLLCMTAMEPPASLDPQAVRDEKVKVIKALRPIIGEDIQHNVVRGQYEAGLSNNERVPRYRDESGVAHDSTTETFVALKAEINNWRWAGVPFYLRTGKRLAERSCEIVVEFKEVPHTIFEMQHKKTMANKLVFRLQPDEGVKIQLCEKRVGSQMQVRPMVLSLNPVSQQKKRVPDAYERLLADAINNNATLFLRQDELQAAWHWIDPILQYWASADQRPEPYNAGTWGPAAATMLLAREGRLWAENS